MEKLLTVEQASAVLSVHGETVRQWLRSGKLRGVKMGHRSWRVPEGALRELTGGMSNGATQSTSEDESTLSGFLTKAEALTQRLERAGFNGVNSAELIRDAREERVRRVAGEGR